MYILVVRVVCTKNTFSHTSTVTTLVDFCHASTVTTLKHAYAFSYFEDAHATLSRVHRNYVKTCLCFLYFRRCHVDFGHASTVTKIKNMLYAFSYFEDARRLYGWGEIQKLNVEHHRVTYTSFYKPTEAIARYTSDSVGLRRRRCLLE